MMNVIETDSTAPSGQVVIPVREEPESQSRRERKQEEEEEELEGD